MMSAFAQWVGTRFHKRSMVFCGAATARNYGYVRHVFSLGYPWRNTSNVMLSWAGAYLRLCSAESSHSLPMCVIWAAIATRRQRGSWIDINTTLAYPTTYGTNVDAVPDDSAFQLASMTHVIEHLTDPKDMLHRIAKRLVPGGKLFITAPFRPIKWRPGDGIKPWLNYSYLHVPAHVSRC